MSLFGGDYTFTPGKDEVIREGSAGYIISFGEALYRGPRCCGALKARWD